MANISKIQISSGAYDLKDEKAIHSFNTLNDLKTSTYINNGDYVKTLGYYSINDGGDAYYLVREKEVSDVPNNNDIIALNNENLIAEIIVADELNAKQFGCYGNNTNDDTTNLQNAIDYCELNKYNLVIPSGNYKISAPLEITGCNIRGYYKNTFLWLYNSDGLHLKPYLEQTVCEIKGLSFYSNDSTHYLEMCGIDILQSSDTNRSRGYNIHECYFENLGCAIEINDAFRTTVKDININNCFRSLFIKNQTVQSYFNNIVSNYDSPNGLTSTRYGNKAIGIQVGVENFTQRCEGIKIEACCMTGHEIGLYIYDCLFCNVLGCEFDLCRKEGVIVFSHEGNCNIKNNWIATQSYTDEPIIDVQTSNTTTKFRLNIESNLIGCLNGNLNKIGIAVGRIADFYFKNNVNIFNNTIKTFSGSTPLKYGIYVDRGRNCTIINNNAFGCSTADIYFAPDQKGILNNNIVDNLEIIVYSGTTLYAYSNLATTITKSIAGTLIGDIE